MRFRALWRQLLNGLQVVGAALTFPITETQGGTNQTSYAKGDVLYASAADTLAKLGIGGEGQVLRVKSGVPIWADIIDFTDMAVFYEEFNKAWSNFWKVDVAGTGSGILIRGAGSDTAHPSVAEFHTGTSTSGQAFLYENDQDDTWPAPAGSTWEALAAIPVLSTGTDRFDWQWGHAHGIYVKPAQPTDGIWISCKDDVNGGNFTLNCSNSSTITSQDLGVAPTAGTFFRVGFKVNAARSSVQGYVNGVARGSPITTNLPATSSKGMMFSQVTKSAGTTDRLVYLDALKMIMVNNR